MPKKLINKNEKKKSKKKINGAYLQVPTKLKIKSPSPFRKNQTQKHKKKLQRRAKTRSLGAKSFTRNNTFGHVYESILSSIIKPNL